MASGIFKNAVAAVLCGLLLPLVATVAQADKRVALVIGNSAYQNAPLLPNPVRDAKAMAAMFQSAGYEVSTAYDLGNLDLKRTIRHFEDGAADAEVAVVYFAGHGIEIRGVNYVIPVDAKLASDRDADDEAVTLDRLAHALEGAKRLRLVILDACRDNPFVRKMAQRTSFRGVTSGMAMVEPTSINTLIAYAAKTGTAADDGDGDHSPFTTALLDNLFMPGLDVRLALGRARDEVMSKTANQQEPFVYGSLGGANIAIVPLAEQPAKPAVDPDRVADDYSRVEKINTRGGWEAFLAQYASGFYADLARERLAVIDRAEKAAVKAADQAQIQKTSAAKEQAEKDQLAKEQAEKDRLAVQQAEKDRQAKAQAEKDRLAAEQAEKDRRAAEQARVASAAQAERDKIARAAIEEQEAKAQLAIAEATRQRLEAERAAQQAEQARQAAQAAAERLAKEQVEKAAAQAASDHLAKEQAEKAAAQAASDRLAKEQAEKDRLAQQERENAKAATPAPSNAGVAGDDKTKIALLTPPADTSQPATKTLTGSALVVAIKQELKRVGCYAGAIDDKWASDETKSSLKKFIKFAKLPDAPDQPASDFLDSVRGRTGRVCPLQCGAREMEKGGACVAKVCPSGMTLDSDGDCTRGKPEKASVSRATEAEAVPAPAPQTMAPRGGRMDMPCRNPRWHRLPGGGCGY